MSREEAVRSLLKTVPETRNPNTGELREGLKDTPIRVAEAWKHWFGGYDLDPKALLKSFEDGAEGYDEMVVVANIDFFSVCEHHLASIIGKATVGYIPKGRIVGLSKLARLVDVFARRLQVQERMTNQIADSLWQGLDPVGVGVHIMARHLCMESRGAHAIGTVTHTTKLLGAMKDEPETRAEFLSYIDRTLTL